jgi:hypothetical protein
MLRMVDRSGFIIPMNLRYSDTRVARQMSTGFDFRLAGTLWLRRIVRRRKVNHRGFGAPAGGVHQGKFGGDFAIYVSLPEWMRGVVAQPTGTWSAVEKRHGSVSQGRYRVATSIRSAPSCTGVTGSDYCRQPTVSKHSRAVHSYGCYRSGLPRKSPSSRCTRIENSCL